MTEVPETTLATRERLPPQPGEGRQIMSPTKNDDGDITDLKPLARCGPRWNWHINARSHPLNASLAPHLGFEPRTGRLTVDCSAVELARNRPEGLTAKRELGRSY